MANCNECEASIVWAIDVDGVRNRANRSLPFDKEPATGGDQGPFKKAQPPPPPPGAKLWTLINGNAKVATDEDSRLRRPLHVCHFDTCTAKKKGR